jgi:hypothetical protein
MAASNRQWLSAGRCMAFALWAVEHGELVEDVDAVRNAMRCTEPQAHALIRGLREARKRPARPPKARALRRRALRAAAFPAGGMQQRLSELAAYESMVDRADARSASAAEMQDAARYFAGFRVGHGAESERVDVEPDVAAYVAASVRAAELPARPARCATGHSTCTRAHLGIGGQCHAGRCHVHAADVAAGQGVESLAHG